jgi:hypothetical protein
VSTLKPKATVIAVSEIAQIERSVSFARASPISSPCVLRIVLHHPLKRL